MRKSIKHSYHVVGMSCDKCAQTVKNKLSAVNGVEYVSVKLENKEAEIISSQDIKIDTLQDALRGTGYSIAELSTQIA